jgi:hypothetical protein
MHSCSSAPTVTAAAAAVLHSCSYSCAAAVVQLTAFWGTQSDLSLVATSVWLSAVMCYWRVSTAAVVCCSAALVCSSAGYSCAAVL